MKRVQSPSKNRWKERNVAHRPIMPGASAKKAKVGKNCTENSMGRAATARNFRGEMNWRSLIL